MSEEKNKCLSVKDKLLDMLEAELNGNADNLSEEQVEKVAKAICSLATANYYCEITEAMEESEYGVDYDEKGRKFYPNRNRRMPAYRIDMREVDDMRYYNGMRYYDDGMDGRYPMRDTMSENRRGRMYHNGMMYGDEPIHDGGDPIVNTHELIKFLGSEKMMNLIENESPEIKNQLRNKMQIVSQQIK